jgi:hypothetical protein
LKKLGLIDIITDPTASIKIGPSKTKTFCTMASADINTNNSGECIKIFFPKISFRKFESIDYINILIIKTISNILGLLLLILNELYNHQ